MKYAPGDAYAIKYLKGDTEFHRRCMDELSEDNQMHLDDILK